MKEGGGGEGECKRERALGFLGGMAALRGPVATCDTLLTAYVGYNNLADAAARKLIIRTGKTRDFSRSPCSSLSGTLVIFVFLCF